MKTQCKFFPKLGIVLLMSFSSSALLAAGVADVLIDSGGLSLAPTVSYDGAGLRVSSDNYDVTTEYANGESIRVDVAGLADGVYGYELSLATAASESAPNGSAVQQRGSFKVQDGIASPNSADEQAAEAEAARVANMRVDNGENGILR